jgi:hypothetical protein
VATTTKSKTVFPTLPSSGPKPAGLTKVTSSQWATLENLSIHGKLHGVPPAIVGAIQQAEAPGLGSTWGINSEGYGGGFGVGVGTESGTVPSESDLLDQNGAGYEAQAIAASDVFSNQLISNNGDVFAAEFGYQNGPNATPGVPINGVLPTTEGVGIFAKITSIPSILAGKWGTGTGQSRVAQALGELVPNDKVLSQGAAQAGLGPGPGPGTTTAADKAVVAADAVTESGASGGTSSGSAPAASALSSISGDVTKDLQVAGYLLGGAACIIVGLIFVTKRKSQMEEIGWLLLWIGAMLLWSVLTKRSPVCVFKAVVSGTDTSGCAGTISGGNLFAGTLTALGAVFAGSALLSAAKGVGGGGGGGGNGSSEEKTGESTAESAGGETAAAGETGLGEAVGTAAEALP